MANREAYELFIEQEIEKGLKKLKKGKTSYFIAQEVAKNASLSMADKLRLVKKCYFIEMAKIFSLILNEDVSFEKARAIACFCYKRKYY